MIIVEGPDNTGKSTLVKALTEYIPSLVYIGHSPGPPKTPEEFLNRTAKVLNHSPQDTAFYLLDRFFFSELVYGPVLRGRAIITPGQIEDLADKLYEHNPLIIYCRRSVTRVKETFQNREQLMGVYDNLARIHRKYDEVISNWSLNTTVYDFERTSEAEVALTVAYYLQGITGGIFVAHDSNDKEDLN